MFVARSSLSIGAILKKSKGRVQGLAKEQNKDEFVEAVNVAAKWAEGAARQPMPLTAIGPMHIEGCMLSVCANLRLASQDGATLGIPPPTRPPSS